MNTPLFSDFVPTTSTQWIEKIKKELKGIQFEQLYTQTYEGITISPFYTAQDTAPQQVFPCYKTKTGWQNCIKVNTQKMFQEPKYVANWIQKGADALWLDLRSVKTLSTSHWSMIFDEVDTSQLTITVQAHENTPAHLETLSPIKFQNFYLCYDALHYSALQGEMPQNYWQELHTILQNPDFQIDRLIVNAQHWNNAGANAIQELAFVLTTAIEYVHQLTELGAEPAQVLAKMGVSLSIGSHYFMEIAKLNVLPLLWANICQAYNYQPNGELFIHAQNNTWNKLQADAYNNMLRATTEAMAAVLGGSHSLTVLPYNLASEDEFALRIAKNVSIILKEESHLDKTLNPTQGTYFLEQLQTQLAQQAWNLLQTIENSGGFWVNLLNNTIQTQVQALREQRLQDFDKKKLVLVGLNKYPNPNEPTPNEKPHFISLFRFS